MKLLIILALCASSFAQFEQPRFSRERVADKKFWTLQAMSWTAAAFDIHSTRHAITHCGWTELNPIYGPRPSARRLILTNVALKAGSGLLSYKLKKKGKWYWSLFAVGDTVSHSALAARNYGCNPPPILHPGEIPNRIPK